MSYKQTALKTAQLPRDSSVVMSQIQRQIPKGYGVPYVSKIKNKRVFIYPAQNIQIQCRIYKPSQVYIHPAQDLYIQPGIYIFTTGFIYPVRDIIIYPARDLYIQPGIYISVRDLYIQHGIYISSQGYISTQ